MCSYLHDVTFTFPRSCPQSIPPAGNICVPLSDVSVVTHQPTDRSNRIVTWWDPSPMCRSSGPRTSYFWNLSITKLLSKKKFTRRLQWCTGNHALQTYLRGNRVKQIFCFERYSVKEWLYFCLNIILLNFHILKKDIKSVYYQ